MNHDFPPPAAPPYRISVACDCSAKLCFGLNSTVKVGAGARLETAATRWQFLEHQHAFGVDSVMLVDPDAGALSTWLATAGCQ